MWILFIMLQQTAPVYEKRRRWPLKSKYDLSQIETVIFGL